MINSIKQKLEQINLIDTTDHKKAGVMIILLQNANDSDIKILFTKRSSSLSTHSGEVSFPGGKWEEGDKDLYETALRGIWTPPKRTVPVILTSCFRRG